MSQEMTPRPGDLPATSPASFEHDEPARPGQTANTPTYSAPSPADRPTVLPSGQRIPTGQVPPADRAWSQDSRDTGPVQPQHPATDQAWWEPRPSGAWATPGWNTATGRPNTGQGAGAYGTQSYPGQSAG